MPDPTGVVRRLPFTYATDDDEFLLTAFLAAKSSLHHPCISRAVESFKCVCVKGFRAAVTYTIDDARFIAAAVLAAVVDAPSRHITSGRDISSYASRVGLGQLRTLSATMGSYMRPFL